jgi:hypothetical protein
MSTKSNEVTRRALEKLPVPVARASLVPLNEKFPVVKYLRIAQPPLPSLPESRDVDANSPSAEVQHIYIVHKVRDLRFRMNSLVKL